MKVKIFSFSLTPFQLGAFLGISIVVLTMIDYYLIKSFLFVFLKLILLISTLIVTWISIRKEPASNLNFKNLLILFSKILQPSIFISFAFQLYLHDFIDPNLKNRLAENIVIENRIQFGKMESEQKMTLTNKEEMLSETYHEVVNRYSNRTLFFDYIKSVFFILVIVIIVSFVQKT
jgi:hypothetical protein